LGIRLGIVAATVLATALAGCGDDDPGDGSTAPQGLDGEWVLDVADSAPPVDAGRAVTLEMDGDQLSGAGPCNSYRASLQVDGETVAISGLASTQRACEDPVNQAEADYFAALQDVTGAEVVSDRLVLTGPEVRLTFDSYDEAELLVGEWHVVSVNRGSAIESVMTGTDPLLTFDGSGELTMATGCNDARGSWTLEGDQLDVGPLRQTRKSCSEPDGIMAQEAALVAALEAADRIEVAPGRLILLDGEGSMVMYATTEPPE
jgi:heat shock protein HslJ